MCCMRLAGNTGPKKIAQNSLSEHHRTTVSGYIVATKACVDSRKKLVKQQYLLHMHPQYGELRPTGGWDLLVSLGHSSKFQPVSHLSFATAPTSLTGDQPNFARCLAISWTGTLHTHFRGCCPLTEFCQLQNSLRVQVLLSPILAVWLYGTRAVAVSQTLWRGTRNGITELSQRVPPIFGCAAIMLGIGPQIGCLLYFYSWCGPSVHLETSGFLGVYISCIIVITEVYLLMKFT